MSGALPLLSLYAFMACIGIAFFKYVCERGTQPSIFIQCIVLTSGQYGSVSTNTEYLNVPNVVMPRP